MPRYQVQEDEIVTAAGPDALVDYLWRTSMVPVASAAAWRLRAAHWVQILHGTPVRTSDNEVFVADMIRCGRYSVVEE